MGLNWDAFSENVNQAIKGAAKTYSGLTIADINREKDLQQQYAIMAKQQEYHKDIIDLQNKHDFEKMKFGQELNYRMKDYEQKLARQQAQWGAKYQASLDGFVQDPDYGALQIFDSMGGPNSPGYARAQARANLVDRYKRGEAPAKGDAETLQTFTPGARAKMNELIKENLKFKSEMESSAAYRAYMRKMSEDLSGKDLDPSKMLNLYMDSQSRLESQLKSMNALEQDTGYQSSIQAATAYTGPNGEVDQATWQNKDPKGYAIWRSYQERRGSMMDVIETQRGITAYIEQAMQDVYKMNFLKRNKEGEDKAIKTEGGQRVSNKKPEPRQSFGQSMVRSWRNVGDWMANRLESAVMPKPKFKALAEMYNLKPDEEKNTIVLQSPEDYERIKAGYYPITEGTLIYDPWAEEMVKAFVAGDGSLKLMQVRQSKTGVKNIKKRNEEELSKTPFLPPFIH